MKVRNLLVLLFLSFGMAPIIAGCTRTGPKMSGPSAQEQPVVTYQEISPEKAKERLESDPGIVLLDVRTQEEFQEKHIPKSILIPLSEIQTAPEQIKDKNSVIFLYCRTGNRSRTAAQALVSMGYRNVYNLGGIINWPYETETGK